MTAQRVSETIAGAAPQSVGAQLAHAARRLDATSDSARLDAELLLAFVTGRSRTSLAAFPERELAGDDQAAFAALVARRSRGEPIAYLIGEREFFSLSLIVTPAVLVPRPDTELLVETALALAARIREPSILDVGTGSGAIALAIKHALPSARVTGSDASAEALGVARDNARRHGLDVHWVQSHWLDAFATECFDLVVSNPPYVRSADVRGELQFEPCGALDGGADGLDAYRSLLAAAPAHLTDSGLLLLEHGAEQRDEIVALAQPAGWRVAAAHDDLAGRPRVLGLQRSARR